MGMASGESDIYFGTNVGKWGAEGAGIFFLGLEGEKVFFSTPCVTQGGGGGGAIVYTDPQQSAELRYGTLPYPCTTAAQ